MSQPSIEDVRRYWEKAPLLSHEFGDVGTAQYFENLNAAKMLDSDRFALGYWDFDRYADQRVLDIGCGPGWLSVQYARAGAIVSSIDLTARAVSLAKRHTELRGVYADIRQGNAEDLPFDDEAFDLVVASGVLHHTPDANRAFREAFRVTRPGGRGKITLYRKGTLHRSGVFALTRLVMRRLGICRPGANLACDGSDVDDFIRRYDGNENPLGIGKSNTAWAADLTTAGWTVEGYEVHYFPLRFVPAANITPIWLHRLLDKLFGTMVYFRLRK